MCVRVRFRLDYSRFELSFPRRSFPSFYWNSQAEYENCGMTHARQIIFLPCMSAKVFLHIPFLFSFLQFALRCKYRDLKITCGKIGK